jgi:hypothetical protein
MTTPVNIKATFKKATRDLNGLESIASKLLDHRKAGARYLVVAIVRPHKSTWSADDGVETPTVTFDHIEVGDGDIAERLKAILDELYMARTKQHRQESLLDHMDPAVSGPAEDVAEEDGPVSERTPDAWLTERASA